MKQLAQTVGMVAGIAGGASGVGATVYSAFKGKLVTRDEYDQAAKQRAADDAARQIQLAGWQQTLNGVADSQKDLAESHHDLSKKLDDLIFRLIEERRRR